MYDPRKIENNEDVLMRLNYLEEEIENTGFGRYIPSINTISPHLINTNYGEFLSTSVHSYQLNPIEFSLKIESNIPKLNESAMKTNHSSVQVPLQFETYPNQDFIPDDWNCSVKEKAYLDSICLSQEESIILERETTKQSECELWFSVSTNNSIQSIHTSAKF